MPPGSLPPVPSPLRSRVSGLAALLVAGNVAAWLWAGIAFHGHPVLLGTAVLAYSLGLRHAVDADHIAAIDNVTRTLMQSGQRPLTVGLFFSLGHSTIVIAASVALAATAATMHTHLDVLRGVGSVVGTAVSATFLFAIAACNLLVLATLVHSFRAVRAGRVDASPDAGGIPLGGLLGRLFRPLFRLISRSWHMYPLGILFGLGFDTATEIAVLGISAAEASKGLPVWSILVFPALFAAGMSLVDTADGVLMVAAYGWAFVNPLRKLYYNLTITAVSAVIALAVGAIETLGLIGDRLQLGGWFWDAIGALSHDFTTMGLAIVALFVGGWIVSIVVYRLRVTGNG